MEKKRRKKKFKKDKKKEKKGKKEMFLTVSIIEIFSFFLSLNFDFD